MIEAVKIDECQSVIDILYTPASSAKHVLPLDKPVYPRKKFTSKTAIQGLHKDIRELDRLSGFYAPPHTALSKIAV